MERMVGFPSGTGGRFGWNLHLVSEKFFASVNHCDKLKYMDCLARVFSPQLAASDFAEGFVAIFLLGGAKGVDDAAKRRAGWHGDILFPFATMLILWVVVAYGWAIGLSGVLAAICGSAISLLAQNSLRKQLKAAKNFDTAAAVDRFLTRLLLISQRLTRITFVNQKISRLLTCVHAVVMEAFQRMFEALGGLVHLALSKRLLPVPTASL